MKGTVIIKLGGSVITEKDGDTMRVREDVLTMLASEIGSAKDIKIIVVHGAGPYGHVPAKEYGLDKGGRDRDSVWGMALTHQSMERLNAEVVAALIDAGISAMAVQPSSLATLSDGRIYGSFLEPLKAMLDLGIVPVLYGDVLSDSERGIAILSGDQLVPHLASELSVERVLLVTSFNGIYDMDPHEDGAKKYDIVDESVLAELEIRQTKGTDVTGGIRGKVGELMELADRGISSEIIGAEPGYLKRALAGERGIGTVIG